VSDNPVSENPGNPAPRRVSTTPTGTYRLQFRAEFGFEAAAELADYLGELGVSHVYTSPILQAVPGSAHGYDVVDHSRISDDLGGESAFRAMAARFRERGIGLVVDVVPNHMAIPAPESLNRPFWDVLREGQAAAGSRWFDIDWSSEEVVLPVLGKPYREVQADLLGDGDVLRYFEHVFPLPGHYRLAYWKSGEPNYRRFFDISTLIGVRVEEPEVFDATHRVLLGLMADGLIDGLRIDHPDGLADPRGYLRTLAERTGGAWTVVEKILIGDERLPADWPCAGTTGYDALGIIGGLFNDPAGERPLTEMYVANTGGPAEFEPVERAAKRYAAERILVPEVDRLHGVLVRILPEEDPAALRAALVELVTAMPVYRTGRGRAGRGRGRARGGGGRVRPAARPGGRARARHRRPRRGQGRVRGAVPADRGADDGQGRRGHRLLPLVTAHRAERGRRRPGAVRGEPGGLPRLLRQDRQGLAGHHDDAVHP
jgi:maltooligosyltrehalose synthase